MNEYVVILIYFLVGFINHVGWTLWYLTIESRKALLAGLVSTGLTILDYTVLAYMILSVDFMPRLISFAIGTGIGTVLMVSYKKKKK